MKRLVLIMIMLVMVGCDKKPDHSEYDERITTKNENIKTKTEVRDAAEKIVKYKVKLPTTVQFERRYDVDIEVQDIKQNDEGQDVCAVSGYFTSENSYGGKVQIHYVIFMEKTFFGWEARHEPILIEQK